MTDFVSTAINAAKTPLIGVAIPLVVGAIVVAVIRAALKI